MTGDHAGWVQLPSSAALLGVEVPCPECGVPLPAPIVGAMVRGRRTRYEIRVGVCEAWCALLGGELGEGDGS